MTAEIRPGLLLTGSVFGEPMRVETVECEQACKFDHFAAQTGAEP